ncbi:MAG: universal stress protein [Candidatus Limnocylindrales bacterium]
MGDSKGPGQFARAVLGLNGGPTDPLVVGAAARMAKQAKTELVAVHVIEVDWTHDLSEVVPGAQQRASEVLDVAEAQAERHGVALKTTLLQARDVGAAIVDEAVSVNADVIVLGLAYRTKFGGNFAIGRVVPYVLENAPMAVMVVRSPIAAATDSEMEPRASARG